MTGSDSRRMGTDVRASKNSLGGGAGMRASYENPIPEEDEHVEIGAMEKARNTASPGMRPGQQPYSRPGLPAPAQVTTIGAGGRAQPAAAAKAAAAAQEDEEEYYDEEEEYDEEYEEDFEQSRDSQASKRSSQRLKNKANRLQASADAKRAK